LAKRKRSAYDARIGIFLVLHNSSREIIEIINAYVSPNIEEKSKPQKVSIKIATGLGDEFGQWIPISVNINEIKRKFSPDLQLDQIKYVSVVASVYGHSKMEIPTIGFFKDFSLIELPEQENIIAARDQESPRVDNQRISSPVSRTSQGSAFLVMSGIDSNCSLRTAKIAVPDGYRATGFQILDFQHGFTCGNTGIPELAGVSISAADMKIYRYESSFKGRSKENMPLQKLNLQAGVYIMEVQGGIGTAAVIQYSLEKLISAGR
jgi:hypothetical protein